MAFALLVAATVAAFFVAQKLKATPPVVGSINIQEFVSPNGDGIRDSGSIAFRLKKADDVTVEVVDENGDRVRRLARGLPARPFRPVRLEWDGQTDDGARAPDGTYRVRLALRRQGRSVTLVPGIIRIDTRPPAPVVSAVEPVGRPAPACAPKCPPTIVSPGEAVRVRIRRAGRRKAPEVIVLRTDTDRPEEVARLRSRRVGTGWRATWDGLVGGAPAPLGTYLMAVRAEDRAGNTGTVPRLPPVPGEVPGRPGVTVRGLAVQPPVRDIRAGSRVEFRVDARGRDFRWRVRRVGAARPVKRGSIKAGETKIVMRAPRGISGLYLLEVRSGRYGVKVPFAVQSEARSPTLVVLPLITWLGTDRIDSSGDGVPDTLSAGASVPYPRLLSGDAGLPPRFAEDVAPLLVALDRQRIRYDLTTDLALAESEDPRPTDRPGVLFVGGPRWITRQLGTRLRRYVNGGGRVAVFGPDALQAGVSLGRTALRRPTKAVQTDALGGRLDELRRASTPPEGVEPLPLEPLEDDPDLGLLEATDGRLAGFTTFEELLAPGRGRLLVGVGQPVSDQELLEAENEQKLPREAHPALSAVRQGKGLVIRIGLPEWVPRMSEDPKVAQITRNIVDLLRGVRPKPRSFQGKR